MALSNLSTNERRPFRILVADDSAEIRELLAEAFRSIACIVTCVDDGLQALAVVQTESYDLLVTDYQMPHLDGLALVRCLQASGQPPPSVLITGHNSPDLIEEARQAGVAIVLCKPFAILDLLSLVESLKDHRPAR